MYNVTEEELGLLRAVGPTLSIAFFGIAIGALATFIGTLQTQTLGNRANAVFIGFAAAAAAIALITGIQAIVGYGRLHRITKKIRERPAE
jgi:Na+/H+ antiporter NhaD/arsenite permease-like protein